MEVVRARLELDEELYSYLNEPEEYIKSNLIQSFSKELENSNLLTLKEYSYRESFTGDKVVFELKGYVMTENKYERVCKLLHLLEEQPDEILRDRIGQIKGLLTTFRDE